MTTQSMNTWEKFIAPYLGAATSETRQAIHHVHKAGYFIAELKERPGWETNVLSELQSLEAALDCALKDVRVVLKAYDVKPVMEEAPIKTLQAAE